MGTHNKFSQRNEKYHYFWLKNLSLLELCLLVLKFEQIPFSVQTAFWFHG